MSKFEREEYYLINRQHIVSIDLISTNRLPRPWDERVSPLIIGEMIKNPGKKKKKKKWTKWIKNFH